MHPVLWGLLSMKMISGNGISHKINSLQSFSEDFEKWEGIAIGSLRCASRQQRFERACRFITPRFIQLVRKT